LTEELKDSFKVFDSNNDGYISATEVNNNMPYLIDLTNMLLTHIIFTIAYEPININ